MTGGYEQSHSFLSSALLYPEDCSVPSLEEGLAGHVTFITQDSTPSIATCGGQIGASNFKRECHVLQSDGWQPGVLDDLPDVRDRSGSVTMGEGVYILGGRKTHSTSIFLRANSKSWETGPNLPSPTGDFADPQIWHDTPCAAQVSAHSFLLQYKLNVFEFNTRANGPTSALGWAPQDTWPRLKKTNVAAGCAVVNNMFVVASDRGAEVINIWTRTITQGGEFAKKRQYFKLLSIDGHLYALGGWYWSSALGHHFHDEVERFSEETRTWTSAPALPGRRADGGGVAVHRALVCG